MEPAVFAAAVLTARTVARDEEGAARLLAGLEDLEQAKDLVIALLTMRDMPLSRVLKIAFGAPPPPRGPKGDLGEQMAAMILATIWCSENQQAFTGWAREKGYLEQGEEMSSSFLRSCAGLMKIMIAQIETG